MALEALKEDLRKRDEDIDKLYTHLLSLNDEQLCNIVKANMLVMLYNKVEFFFREFILVFTMISMIKRSHFLS